MNYIMGEKSITVFIDGKILTCGKDQSIYPLVAKALEEKRWDDVSRLFHKYIIEDAKEKLLKTGGKWIDNL